MKTTKEEIKAWLWENPPATTQSIAEGLGICEFIAYRALRSLVKAGEIEKQGGYYFLTAPLNFDLF